jgi:hypothetical protein
LQMRDFSYKSGKNQGREPGRKKNTKNYKNIANWIPHP